MKALYALGFVGLTALSVQGQVPLYGQCGGKNWTGPTTCVSGAVCVVQNPWYFQCVQPASSVATTTGTGPQCGNAPGTTATTTTSARTGFTTTRAKGTSVTTVSTTTSAKATPTTTASTTTSAKTRLTTTRANATSTTTTSTTTSAKARLTTTTRAKATPTTTSTSNTTSAGTTPTTTGAGATPTGQCGSTPPASAGKLMFAGVNIAGFDFGMSTDGSGSASAAEPPLAEYGIDGVGQMTHFVKDDGYNIFRLPVGWQYLTGNVATGTLNQGYFSEYDTLVKGCLTTGAHCIIDVHNYARWNGQIIGQGGPSEEVFASLWSSLASHYANEDKVIFGIMNEPHDLPSLETWAETVQAAVTAIRKAGATTQTILLPGDHWTSVLTLVSGGSADALAKITNPDGSHTNLVFDVHMYLDSDSSGTSDTCVTNHIADAWEQLVQWLRCHGRQALNTETGGGNTASCKQYMCEQIEYMAKNSDVLLGYVGWSAGSFSASYTLSETPTKNGGSWTDQSLVATCMAPSVNHYVA